MLGCTGQWSGTPSNRTWAGTCPGETCTWSCTAAELLLDERPSERDIMRELLERWDRRPLNFGKVQRCCKTGTAGIKRKWNLTIVAAVRGHAAWLETTTHNVQKNLLFLYLGAFFHLGKGVSEQIFQFLKGLDSKFSLDFRDQVAVALWIKNGFLWWLFWIVSFTREMFQNISGR